MSQPSEPATGERPAPKTSAPRSARRRSRELAMQGLYQWLLSQEDAGAIQAHLLDSPGYAKADAEHFDSLLNGVLRSVQQLHDCIGPNLDRAVDELSPVEHAVLLLGAYELANHPEIPYRVVINEAVELAKTFGGTDGFKYVNGVLDRVAMKLRPHEANSRRG
ncbi:MAG: transcription antitermination factor NusB [Quisquiliibacterium sp.]